MMNKKVKRKEVLPCIEVKKIWRDDAIIHPDGRREGAWVECKVYQAEAVPETREGYVQGTGKKINTQEGIESFADLYHRFMEQQVLEGKGVEKGEDDGGSD